MPVREIPHVDKISTENGKNDSTNGKELSKLERNLRRFEEERRRFELEKRQFDKEKREHEIVRYRRFEEIERKRAQRKIEELKQQADVHEKLYSILRVIEDSKHHLPSILKSENSLKTSAHNPHPDNENIISSNKTNEQTVPRSQRIDLLEFPDVLTSESPDVCDDYESSTALSSSSREGDFDDEIFSSLTIDDTHVQNEKVPEKIISKVIISSTNGTASHVTDVPAVVAVVKPSFLGRLFGRKPKCVTVTAKIPERLPTLGPVTLRQFLFVESRLVWRKLLADYPNEWKATMQLRNKCIADLIILTIFCGFGGMVFRFVEGAFENFYKCGVRRVKRDFVDHLWHTSHNLRFRLFPYKYIIYFA